MSSKTELEILPTNVKPRRYDIHLTPNFETFQFLGEETVVLEVAEPTNTISLNALGLTIHKAALIVGAEKIGSTDISYENESERVILSFPQEIAAGEASIVLTFEGTLNDQLCGFYRSKFVDSQGTTHWMATTQFEAVGECVYCSSCLILDARRAFPCWDEPARKAVFGITLTVPASMTALSNMPAKQESVNGDLKTILFEDTPIVSTYLIAFCIGDFECVEGTTPEGITFRVWTTLGKKEMGRFALDVGIKVISYFAEYYGIAYPLPKQDMIAIPDFSAGAMENWGLITYRETALLCDAATSAVAAKARVAYVVAHELAHQWFGNLVTMEWWQDLWLNEGFATFVGTQAVAKFFPEWDVWVQFLGDYVFRAMQVDSLRGSHPIEVPISKAREIDQIFDTISYCKVIRMIESYLGEADFRKGLNIYLNRFKYKNATTADLWAGLSEGSGKDVATIMDTWVRVIGFPVVEVEEAGEKGKLRFSQSRFLSSGLPTPEEDTTVWPIYLSISTKSHPEPIFVEFKDRTAVFEVPVKDSDEWIKVNAGQTGLFRVSYSSSLSSRLGQAVLKQEISAADRLGILDDIFALARAGRTPLWQALDMARNYLNETDYSVWFQLNENLRKVGALFADTPAKDSFDKFMLALYDKITEIGWEPKDGEKELNRMLRALVISTLISHGHQPSIDEAKRRFNTFVQNNDSLSRDLSRTVFGAAVRFGDDEQWNQLFEYYKTTSEPTERIKALYSLGSTRNPDLLKRALELIFSEHVRSQDSIYVISSAASSSSTRLIAWTFIKENWDKLKKLLEGSMGLLGSIVSSFSEFNTVETADEFENFFKDKDAPARPLSLALESIRANTAYRTREGESAGAWLAANFA